MTEYPLTYQFLPPPIITHSFSTCLIILVSMMISPRSIPKSPQIVNKIFLSIPNNQLMIYSEDNYLINLAAVPLNLLQILLEIQIILHAPFFP